MYVTFREEDINQTSSHLDLVIFFARIQPNIKQHLTYYNLFQPVAWMLQSSSICTKTIEQFFSTRNLPFFLPSPINLTFLL